MIIIKKISRHFIDFIKGSLLLRYYNFKKGRLSNSKPVVIYMADGRMKHGGLSDRLCGLISTYNYCKKNGCDFRINFKSPYQLDEILQPSNLDWRIKDEDISYSLCDSKPVYISFRPQYDVTEKMFEKALNGGKKQYHVYTNARYFRKEEFPQLFGELFQPVNKLRELIEKNLEMLPKGYVSITYRFQQLLGDFKEDGYRVIIDKNEKETLIDNCLSVLDKLFEKYQKRILVTSDSSIFLKKASEKNFVYTIPGQIRHMDFTDGVKADILIDMKSYVDFYMLANADCIYRCVSSPLYGTSFPETASYVYNKKLVTLSGDFSQIII